MAPLVSALSILLLSVMMNSYGANAHRLCGFKLAKIIRQVCDVTECDWSNELLKMEIDDEEVISEKCCAHPTGCTLDYMQKWCCRNRNKYDMGSLEQEERREHSRIGSNKKLPHSRRTKSYRERSTVDDQFINLFI